MARCTLDLSHAFFQQAIKSLSRGHPDFYEGLENAKREIEKEHTSCRRVVQEMPDYPDCKGKIWKYDWTPPSLRSSTRKSWRLVVIVPDPLTQPYQLIAGSAYAKNTTKQLTAKQLAEIFRAVTSPVAAQGSAQSEGEYCPFCQQQIKPGQEVRLMDTGLNAHADCHERRLGGR